MVTKDGAHSAVTDWNNKNLKLISALMELKISKNLNGKFGWVYLLLLCWLCSTELQWSLNYKQTCWFPESLQLLIHVALHFPAAIVHFLWLLLLWFACEGICLGRSPSASPSLLSAHFVTACPLHHFHLSAPLFGSLSLFRGKSSAGNHTQITTHRILLSTVVGKALGRLALCLCKMTTDHHQTLLLHMSDWQAGFSLLYWQHWVLSRPDRDVASVSEAVDHLQWDMTSKYSLGVSWN